MALTPKLSLNKPVIGGDLNNWGALLNANMDILDGQAIVIGSNANGSFVRFADGTQICYVRDVNLGSIVQAGAGTFADPYRTNAVNIVWPASFSSNPAVGHTLQLSGDSVVNPQARALLLLPALGPTTTGWSTIAATRPNGDATNRNALLSLIAIGRWT